MATRFTAYISPWVKMAIWSFPCDAEIIWIPLGFLFRLRWLSAKTIFFLLQNAGKLVRSSPNFGELPRKNLCGQVAQVLTPSPRVDLVREKGTEGLCVRIFHQLLFGQVVLEGSSSPIHTLCARQRRQVFFAMLHGQRTGELFKLVNNFVISNVVLGTETAPGHVTIAEDTSASFLNVLEKFTLVDLMQVLCRGTLSWTGDNWSGQSYIRLPSYFDMCPLRAIKDVVVRTLINTPTPPHRTSST